MCVICIPVSTDVCDLFEVWGVTCRWRNSERFVDLFPYVKHFAKHLKFVAAPSAVPSGVYMPVYGNEIRILCKVDVFLSSA